MTNNNDTLMSELESEIILTVLGLGDLDELETETIRYTNRGTDNDNQETEVRLYNEA